MGRQNRMPGPDWFVLGRAGSKVFAAGAIALGTACSHCGIKDFDPPGIPQIGSVEIIPDTVYAAALTQYSLRARVMTPNGGIINVAAHPQITIEWKASGAAFELNGLNPVVVSVPDSPGTVVADMTATVTRDVNLQGGPQFSQITSDPAVLLITPQTGSGSDWVETEYLPGAVPAVVVLDGLEGSDCHNDIVIAVVGMAYLDRNLVDGATCAPEIAVFSEAREAKFHDRSSLMATPGARPPPWTTGDDHVGRTPLEPLLIRSVSVIVGFEVTTPPNGTTFLDWGMEQVDLAFALMDGNRVGILLKHEKHHERKGGLPVSDLSTACSTDQINDVYLDLISEDIAIDPDLHLILVPQLPGDVKGFLCPEAADQKGRVIFISWAEYSPTTVVHEFGHALSLAAPYLDFGLGHTNFLTGFHRDNIMWDAVDLEVRSLQDHLSVGQIFRMNLHQKSWLNLTLPPESRVVTPCQTDLSAGKCPALSRDPGVGEE